MITNSALKSRLVFDSEGNLIDEKSDNNKIKRIVIISLFLRILVLIIVLLSGSFGDAFVEVSMNVDDWRYETGGEYYSEYARSVIDPQTFTDAYMRLGDSTGHHIDKPITNATIWYWIVCILMYFTKTKWSVRILNVFLSSLSIVYIFRFARLVYSKKTAILASKLFAVLPYPVIFCCFSYKEEVALICTFYLLYRSAEFRYSHKITLSIIFKMLIATLFLFGVRSGVSLILIAICIFIMFFKDMRFIRAHFPIFLCFFGVAIVLFTFLAIRYKGIIIHKFSTYLSPTYVEETGLLQFFKIRSVKNIWRFPFTYFISVMMPLVLTSSFSSWASIVSFLNLFCMTPIAIGATVYAFCKKKKDPLVYWSCILYYSIYLITSLGISRHYAALLPLSLIAFADYRVNLNEKDHKIWLVISILGIIVFLADFLLSMI